jgi:hypothetical protein
MHEVDVKLREMRPSDEAFIANSWKESFRWSPSVRWIPNGPYFGEMNKRVRDIVARAKVLVACNPVADDHIVGWCCTEGNVLHYVYVKTPLRGNGYAMALIERSFGSIPSPVRVTHWTEHCERFARSHQWLYTPSALVLEKGKAA